LEGNEREDQAVELMTFASSALAAVVLIICARRLWSVPAPAEAAFAERRGAAAIVSLIALATFFFAGEEISWGQTYVRWATPDSIRHQVPETNIHNIHGLPISVNSLGSVFLIVMFIVLPVVWQQRKFNLPRAWRPAIPEWPVVFSMVVAFALKAVKPLYFQIVVDPKAQTVYIEFIEQFNEQKEMLVAVTLLMFALYRLAATRSARPAARTP
jgi:hypothetical protein